MIAETADSGTSGRIRLDKWLWAARFYRTRSLSAQAIDAGQVRVDGERVKAAHPIRAGMRVSVRKQALTWSVDVVGVAQRRGSATDAAALYRETADSARRKPSRRLRAHRRRRCRRVGRRNATGAGWRTS